MKTEEERKELDEQFKKGYDAYKEGKLRSSCPYCDVLQTNSFHAWVMGWSKAFWENPK